MKKIMFYREQFYIGGTEIAILSLIKSLKQYDIYIGYTDDTSNESLLNKYKSYAKVVNLNNKFTEKMDVLIICSPYKTALDVDSLVQRNKTVLWFHHFGKRNMSIFTDERFYNMVDEIVTVSETCKKTMLKQDYGNKVKNKIKVIYNVLDQNEIINSANEKIELELSNQLNLVSVGRVCYEKGFRRQLELARLFKKNNINFKWYIVGGNYYKEIEEEIMEKYREYKDNFVFTGFLDNPFNIIKQCDYLVLLSDDETWGLVITEAKILGVPCIITDFDVAYEQIIDNKTGVILSRDNINSYEEKIDQIINNKKVYKENLKDYVWSNEKTIKKWKTILE